FFLSCFLSPPSFSFSLFPHPSLTPIYTLSLHDALPIYSTFISRMLLFSLLSSPGTSDPVPESFSSSGSVCRHDPGNSVRNVRQQPALPGSSSRRRSSFSHHYTLQCVP